MLPNPPNVKYKLVAYEPFGESLGRLPAPISWTYTHSAFGIPLLDVVYSRNAFRSSILRSNPEVAIEWSDSDHSWQEEDNCRFTLINRSEDRKDKNHLVTLRFAGMGWFWTKAEVFDASTYDAEDGLFLPYRRFNTPNAGQILVPLFNAAVERIWEGVVANPPIKHFELLTDTNEADWTTYYDGKVYFKTSQKLYEVESLVIEHGLAETAWHQRGYRAYNFGTYGRDFTGDDLGHVLISYSGVSNAPEDRSFEDLAARVTVVGKGGRSITEVNNLADVTRGILETTVEESTLTSPVDLTRAANAALELGRTHREQLTREWKGAAGFRPLRDYRPRDKVWLQRNQGDDETRWLSLYVTEISIKYQRGKGYSGFTTLSDRHEDRLARRIRRALRQLAGREDGGIGGPPDSEETVKAPAAPTNVQVVVTQYPDENGKTKGQQTITWDPVTLDTEGSPIELRGYWIGEKRAGGAVAFVTQVGRDQTSWVRPELITGVGREISVRAISAYGVPSAWSEDADGTVAEDYDPIGGPNSLVDPYFRSAAIRKAREDDAGAGFIFTLVSSRYYADFSSVTPLLRMGRVAPGALGLRQGRVKVNGGEKWVVGGNYQRIGGGAVSVRFRVQTWDAADTGTAVNVHTVAATTTDTADRTVYQIPTGAVEASLQITAVSLSGGAVLRVHTPVLERQTSGERFEDGAATEDKIGPSAVTNPKLGPSAVSDTKILLGAVTNPKIAADAVTNPKVANSAINRAEIVGDAVGTAEIDSAGVDIGGTFDAGFVGMGTSGSSILDFVGSGDIIATGSGIVTYDAASHQLDGNGNLHGAWTWTGSFGESSRRSTKIDIQPITMEQAEALLALEPSRFRYNPKWQREAHAIHMQVGPREGAPPGTQVRRRLGRVIDDPHVGLMAEDVEATGVLEELLVRKDGEAVGVEIHSGWLYHTPILRVLWEDYLRRTSA